MCTALYCREAEGRPAARTSAVVRSILVGVRLSGVERRRILELRRHPDLRTSFDDLVVVTSNGVNIVLTPDGRGGSVSSINCGSDGQSSRPDCVHPGSALRLGSGSLSGKNSPPVGLSPTLHSVVKIYKLRGKAVLGERIMLRYQQVI